MHRVRLRRLGLLLVPMLVVAMLVIPSAHAASATGTITGRFTDSAGSGAAAWVSATGDHDWPVANTDTDAEGNYSLSVPAGTYRVVFNYGSIRQYAYGTTEYAQAALFAVAAGQTVTVNDAKLTAGSIAGRVIDAHGHPAEYLPVEAEPIGGVGSYATGFTDHDGHYRIDDLLPGAYRLSFRLPSWSTQYAPQSRSSDSAGSFTVVGNAVTTVDEQLLPTGAIAGRFTDGTGAGISDVGVRIFDGFPPDVVVHTDADGYYQADGIFIGTYQVQFQNWPEVRQYAFGQVTEETANSFTVVADRITTVNDSRLPTGSIRYTAKDSVTGAAIDEFFVNAEDWGGNTYDGSFVRTGVPIGTYPVSAGGEGYVYARNLTTVTVIAGQQTELQLTLRPKAKIATAVIDRATGAPVANMCVTAVKPTDVTFPFDDDGCTGRSDETGAVTLMVDDPGDYQLIVLPDPDSPYGAQWVGSNGGTGSQLKAKRLVASTGTTTTGPTIRMDPRGTITGTVTSANGDPVRHGTVGISGPDELGVAERRYSSVATDGTYTIDWLGPYNWPLLFKANDHPYQWSGGVGNRHLARTVSVKAGATTTFDYRLKPGVKLTVKVPGDSGSGRVVVYNAVTGDLMGLFDYGPLAAGVTLQVVGGQFVKVAYHRGSARTWYGGTDFASAQPVLIPVTGSKQVTFPTT